MKKVLFNLTFYPLFFAVTIGMPAVVIGPVLIFRIFAGEQRAQRVIRWLILRYGFIIVRILTFPFVRMEYKVFGEEKKYGACIYVCNHRSSSDAFLMANLNIEAVQVVNNWPFKIPILGWVARVAGYLSVRTMPFEEFLKEGCRLLAQGVSVIAFPEGSRSVGKKAGQFNGAVFRVAQAARVPIVPLCLSGNQRIPEKGSWVLTPGTIRLHQLPALEWKDYKDLTPFKLKNKVREIIQNEVDRLETA